MVRSGRFSLFFSLLALAVLLLLPFGSTVRAQVGQGEITGLVTDPSGASVPNAKVTLTSSATGESRNAQTTSAGLYRFIALPVVGTYAIKVEAAGFKTFEVAGIVVSTGTVITQDVHMEIGAATQTVSVEASTETHIDTTDSSVSTLVDRRLWQSLPLENRTQNTFINILPGVVPDQFGGTTRGAAVNGVRPGMSNYLLDGYDNNDQGQGGRGVGGAEGAPGAVTQLSPDAIQEYRVITNDFPAEYGKGGAFVNDTVLKSGSNDWHGSAFEYNRIQAFTANDFFSNAAGIKDRLVRNQFGGSAGGPIVKDKTFFYATYERHTRRESAPLTTAGTTQDFINFVKTGAFETFMETAPGGFCFANFGVTCPGAFSSSATLGPNFTTLLAKGPFPLATTKGLTRVAAGAFTSNTLGIGFGQITYPVNVYGTVTVEDPFKLDQNKGSIKVDHKLSNKAQLSGTYAITDSFTQDTFGGSDTTIGPPFLNPARSQDLGVTVTYTFTPVLINQFRASYLRRLSNFPDAAGFQGIPSVFTAVDPIGVGFGDTANLPQFFTDNQFQYQDSVTYVYGKHTFKAGGEYRRTRNGSSFQAFRNSLIVPWDVETMLTDGFFGDEADLATFGAPTLGGIAEAEGSINPITKTFPEYYRGYRANEVAWYFQDDFRVAPRFTVNAGLRWEYFGPPHNFRPGIDSNFYFGNNVVPISGTGNPFFPVNSTFAAGVRTGTFQVRNHNIWGKDLNNFGPRLGFAWDVFGSQKVVLRGGYGIFYDRIFNNVFENIRFNPPFFAFALLGAGVGGAPAGPFATPGLYQVPFTSPAAFGRFPATPSARQMDDNLVDPYIQQFHLGADWEVAHNFVLSVNGIGTIGNKLLGLIDANTFDGRTACTTPRRACVNAFNAGEIPSATFTSKRVNTSLSSDNLRTNAFRSNYYGLQIEGRKIFSNGLQFNANYTYSHAIDELSDVFNNGRGILAHPADNFNIAYDRGNADFDIRHRFVVSYYYELPLFKSNRWLGGWSWSGITTVQKGVPVQLIASADTNRDGYFAANNNNGGDRPQYTGPGSINNAIQHSKSPADGYFNTGLFQNFTCPTSVNFGLWCDPPFGRNTLIGPGFVNFDMGLAKKFRITERLALQLQGNFFNIFNRPNFANPDGNLAHAGTTFGNSLSTYGNLGGHRITQLAVRLDF